MNNFKIVVNLFPTWKQAEIQAGRDITLEEVAKATGTTRTFVTRLKDGGEFGQFHVKKLSNVLNYLANISGIKFSKGQTVPIFEFVEDDSLESAEAKPL